MSKRQASKRNSLQTESITTDQISKNGTDHQVNLEEERNTYFWRAHTVTALVIISTVFVYITLFEVPSADSAFNMRRGVSAVILVFILVASIHMPDGPFLRPHPVVWRLFMSCSIVYLLLLIFLLFQNHEDSRKFLSVLDPKLGRPLPEKSYAEDCRIYSEDHPENPFFNLYDKMDVFVPCHFIGWLFKTLILRDFWILTISSFIFEVMEYLLEHQLPNFGECWWDHWLLDFILCNGLGICLGMLILHFLNAKTYQWRSLYNIPTFKGKLKRAVGQFTPYSWTSFHWGYMENIYRWLVIWFIIVFFTTFELNTFYLKAILWVPPNHILNFYRAMLYAVMGAVSVREIHDYLDNKTDIFGRQAWISVFIVIVEVLIGIKFGEDIYCVPWPKWVLGVFAGSISVWSLYTVFYFYPRSNQSRIREKIQ